MKAISLVCVLILSVTIITGCSRSKLTTEMENLAFAYCEEQGYVLGGRTDADGDQYNVCIFPDGRECEMGAFYRGECGPAGSDAEMFAATSVPVEMSGAWVYVDAVAHAQSENPYEQVVLIWMGMENGTINRVSAPGIRHQLVGGWVYYQENQCGIVHRVNAVGQDESFDFMILFENPCELAKWAISPDGSQIVWLRGIFEQDENGDATLTSELYAATIATGETRLLTTYVAHEHWLLAPWRFSPDGSRLFVYLWPYSADTMFSTYGGFGVLDIATGELDFEPSVYPGSAAVLSDDGTRLVRFQYEADLGYKVNLCDVASGQTTEIATIPSDGEIVQVGDGMFAPDGSTLVYTVAYGDEESGTFSLFQMDVATGAQRELLPPQPNRYRVVRFEDDGFFLLTSVLTGGADFYTWSLHPDGTMTKVSGYTLVGVSE